MARKKAAPTDLRTKIVRAKLLVAIKYHAKEIGKHRDALRELITDAEEIAYTSDSAIADLESAVDTLSQYV